MYSLNASEMAESTKVRLVRCPKCENLLPELADYSVYQCGGCGAVLRGKDSFFTVSVICFWRRGSPLFLAGDCCKL